MLALLIISFIGLSYFVYKRISERSMIIAIALMVASELLILYNDYREFKEKGEPISQYQIIDYLLPFTIIFTVTIMLIIKKTKSLK